MSSIPYVLLLVLVLLPVPCTAPQPEGIPPPRPSPCPTGAQQYDLCNDGKGFCDYTGTSLFCSAGLPCGVFPNVTDGFFVLEVPENRVLGATAELSCCSGYHFSGSGNISCTVDQTWSQPSATCEPVDCGSPPLVTGGAYVTSDGTTFMSEGYMTCTAGYVLTYATLGEAFLLCDKNGVWISGNATCEPCEYLVSGADPVSDDQLSASSYYCQSPSPYCYIPDGQSAKYARIDSTGDNTGGWAALFVNTNQYIQVDFLNPRIVSGVVLKSRDARFQYVTAFKVQISLNCSSFETIQDGSGNDKVFVGNDQVDVAVIRYLDEKVVARCVRINPVAWTGWPSLRFDLIDC